MAATQLTFTLRTSANVKTAHLIGSWDNYAGQLPLSKDPSKSGGWKGTFRFSTTTLKQGQRYWYYVSTIGGRSWHDDHQADTQISTSWMDITSPTIRLNHPPWNPLPVVHSIFLMCQHLHARIIQLRPNATQVEISWRSPKAVRSRQARLCIRGPPNRTLPGVSVRQTTASRRGRWNT